MAGTVVAKLRQNIRNCKLFAKITHFTRFFYAFAVVFFLITEKVLTLHRRAYAVPSEKDVRMGGTLHNVKASSMLCLLAN